MWMLACLRHPSRSESLSVSREVYIVDRHYEPVYTPYDRYWRRGGAWEQAKREREYWKDMREARREYERDRREAERDNWKDVREARREVPKRSSKSQTRSSVVTTCQLPDG